VAAQPGEDVAGSNVINVRDGSAGGCLDSEIVRPTVMKVPRSVIANIWIAQTHHSYRGGCVSSTGGTPSILHYCLVKQHSSIIYHRSHEFHPQTSPLWIIVVEVKGADRGHSIIGSAIGIIRPQIDLKYPAFIVV
jgi:hypothetical protein